MTLSADEFILSMPLPEQRNLPAAENDYRERYENLTGRSLRQCPQCQIGRMVIAILPTTSDRVHNAISTAIGDAASPNSTAQS